jgi:hypothetical protein
LDFLVVRRGGALRPPAIPVPGAQAGVERFRYFALAGKKFLPETRRRRHRTRPFGRRGKRVYPLRARASIAGFYGKKYFLFYKKRW